MATWLLRIVLSCHFSNSLLNPTKSRVLTARNASRQRIISQTTSDRSIQRRRWIINRSLPRPNASNGTVLPRLRTLVGTLSLCVYFIQVPVRALYFIHFKRDLVWPFNSMKAWTAIAALLCSSHWRVTLAYVNTHILTTTLTEPA